MKRAVDSVTATSIVRRADASWADAHKINQEWNINKENRLEIEERRAKIHQDLKKRLGLSLWLEGCKKEFRWSERTAYRRAKIGGMGLHRQTWAGTIPGSAILPAQSGQKEQPEQAVWAALESIASHASGTGSQAGEVVTPSYLAKLFKSKTFGGVKEEHVAIVNAAIKWLTAFRDEIEPFVETCSIGERK